MIYHSATTKYQEIKSVPTMFFKDRNIAAFVYDLEDNCLPKEYNDVDFIYSEIPWKQGYEVFNSRANKKGNGLNYFLMSLCRTAKLFKRPIYLVAGKEFETVLIRYCKTKPILFSNAHNCKAVVYCFNAEPENVSTSTDLLNLLFEKYSTGGDFACGYGMTGKIAFKHNKKVVLSDVNPNCIGVIKEQYKNWYENL